MLSSWQLQIPSQCAAQRRNSVVIDKKYQKCEGWGMIENLRVSARQKPLLSMQAGAIYLHHDVV